MKQSHIVPWHVKLVLALIGGLLAVAAISIDLVNAYLYGLTTTHTLAALAVIVAIAVVLLPMWLELGAPRVLWLLWAACVAFTMNCAYQYYSVSAKQNNTHASETHDAYSTAAAEKKLALDTLRRIEETGDVEELGTLAHQADSNLTEANANVSKLCKGKRETDDCRGAKTAKASALEASTAAHSRVSEAKARDTAKATIARAAATQKQGDAVEKDVDIVTLIFALVLVQALAGLSGVATSLGAEALRERAAIIAAIKPAKAKKSAAVAAPTDDGESVTEPGAQIIQLATNAGTALVRTWLAENTARGAGTLRGGDIRKAYIRATGHEIPAKDLQAILATLLPGSIERKASGYVVNNIALVQIDSAAKQAAK